MGKDEKEEKYARNEKVLCYHVEFLYSARIMEVKPERKKRGIDGKEILTPYKVHYDGWNRRYDEWVPTDRLLKPTPENLARAEKSREEAEKAAPGGKERRGRGGKDGGRDGSPASTDSKQPRSSRASVASETNTPTTSSLDTKRPPPSTTSSKPPPSKRGRHAATTDPPSTVEGEKEYSQRPEIRIEIPAKLKTALVDDWDLVTRQMKIMNNSKSATVDELVEEYMELKRGQKGLSASKVSQYSETALGIKDHFNVMLGCQLLYKLERPAYAVVVEGGDEETASSVYGWIHLVRLFVRIGTLLAFTSWSPANITLITSHLHDFLAFLDTKRSECFSHEFYDTTTPEYQKKAWL